MVAAGLGWAFSDILINNFVGIARQFTQYSFSVDFLYSGLSSNLDIIQFICTALLVAKLMSASRIAKKLQPKQTGASKNDQKATLYQLRQNTNLVLTTPVCLFITALLFLRYLEPIYLEMGCNSIELDSKHATCTRLLRTSIDN